jgi:hypothetical protein
MLYNTLNCLRQHHISIREDECNSIEEYLELTSFVRCVSSFRPSLGAQIMLVSHLNLNFSYPQKPERRNFHAKVVIVVISTLIQ